MLESRPKDALANTVKTVEIVETVKTVKNVKTVKTVKTGINHYSSPRPKAEDW